MTSKERNDLQKFYNRMTELMEIEDEAFKELQEANGKINGNRWCCAETNYRELLASGHNYSAMYNKYVKACGARDLLMDLGKVLAENNFWKGRK